MTEPELNSYDRMRKRENRTMAIMTILFLLGLWFADMRYFGTMMACFWIIYGIGMHEMSVTKDKRIDRLVAEIQLLRKQSSNDF